MKRPWREVLAAGKGRREAMGREKEERGERGKNLEKIAEALPLAHARAIAGSGLPGKIVIIIIIAQYSQS
jgi:hypothetical protein